MTPSSIVQKGRIRYDVGFDLFEFKNKLGAIWSIWSICCCAAIILCHMEKKSAVDNFANIWILDYVIIIFSMVRYNKYEYLQHDVFPLER